MIPHGGQSNDDEDVRTMVELLQSNWLTTGPKVDEFEQVFARHVKAREASVNACHSRGATYNGHIGM